MLYDCHALFRDSIFAITKIFFTYFVFFSFNEKLVDRPTPTVDSFVLKKIILSRLAVLARSLNPNPYRLVCVGDRTKDFIFVVMNSNYLSIPTRKKPFLLNLHSTALLLIDMQNDFCHPDSFSGNELGLNLVAIRKIVPNLQKLLSWARNHNVLIIYTKESHRPDLSDLTKSKQLRYENAGSPVGATGKRGRYLVQGEWGTQIINELYPLDSEIQIDKPAHSAFVNSDLEAVLFDREITHLLITGVTTECCVLATYRHANDLGFCSLLLEDCCAAFEEKEHLSALEVLLAENGVIGWVTDSTRLLQAVGST